MRWAGPGDVREFAGILLDLYNPAVKEKAVNHEETMSESYF